MHDGNLPHALLALIACHHHGVHGYRLKREAEALCEHGARINHGRIYRALDGLERSGDLDVERRVQDGRPNRKVYRLSAKGRLTVRTWLAEPTSTLAYPLRDEITLKVMLMGAGDLAALAGLFDQQRRACVGRLDSIARRRTVLRGAGMNDEMSELLVDAAKYRVRAELDWLEHVERRLVRDAAPGGHHGVCVSEPGISSDTGGKSTARFREPS